MTDDARETAPTPSQVYARGASEGQWQNDPAQHPALAELDRIHAALLAEPPSPGLFGRLFGKPPETVKGLYYWGEVGRGKTFLVDLFFSHLELTAKRRIHYHRFMGEVHARIRALGQQADPLAQIAADYAREFRLLCLDEFFVTDIGDAMLLARLLEHLFERGVTLVTTSNTAPENLYKDGLQHASFLPAIILLQAHCHVLEVKSERDYRLRALTHASVWQTPLGDAADAALTACFTRLAQDAPQDDEGGRLEINTRPIPVREMADGVVWFDFPVLCDGPRSVADYIEIARRFHTVIVSGVPTFDRNREDAAYRFVLLVDELYDRSVKLVVSAEAVPTDLYHGQRVAHEFERTVSRLTEMQSEEFLAREHAP